MKVHSGWSAYFFADAGAAVIFLSLQLPLLLLFTLCRLLSIRVVLETELLNQLVKAFKDRLVLRIEPAEQCLQLEAIEFLGEPFLRIAHVHDERDDAFVDLF